MKAPSFLCRWPSSSGYMIIFAFWPSEPTDLSGLGIFFAWVLPEHVSISTAAPHVTPSYYPTSQQALNGLAKSPLGQDTGPQEAFSWQTILGLANSPLGRYGA
jgi:hypothetical protein